MPELPLDTYKQLAESSVALARVEAMELLRRGDTAGANRKLDEAIQMAAEARVRIAAATSQPAPPPPAPAAGPELTPDQRVRANIDATLARTPEHIRPLVPAPVRRAVIERARQAAGVATDGRFNPAESFGLTPRPK